MKLLTNPLRKYLKPLRVNNLIIKKLKSSPKSLNQQVITDKPITYFPANFE